MGRNVLFSWVTAYMIQRVTRHYEFLAERFSRLGETNSYHVNILPVKLGNRRQKAYASCIWKIIAKIHTYIIRLAFLKLVALIIPVFSRFAVDRQSRTRTRVETLIFLNFHPGLTDALVIRKRSVKMATGYLTEL